ncbi:2-dehydropantoate 2-reductase, partial [Burkholderia pseudomallei 354e]
MATICVYGAGAVGCYLGGRLLAGGADVALIGRARIGDELRAHGLALSDYRGRDVRVPPSAIAFSTADAAALATAELVLVTVKSAATP